MAQRGGMSGEDGRENGMNVPNVPMQQSPFDRISESPRLSKDQRKQVRSILDEAQKEATARERPDRQEQRGDR